MKLLKSHKCFNGVTEFYEHDSAETKTTMKFSLHKPSDETKIKGALIWLSGLTCSDENFITKAGAQKYCEELGLMIVCPDTSPRGLDLPNEHDSYDFGSGAGFYVDATTNDYKTNYRMYSYVNDELYNLINEKYALGGNISISGHSMGGHGALIIALKNKDKYKSVSAFSPIVHPVECEWGKKAFRGYLGEDQQTWKSWDACELIAGGITLSSAILIDQGLNDQFYPDQLRSKDLEETCSKSDQKLKINFREGYDHSYYFISTFIEDHLKHHAANL